MPRKSARWLTRMVAAAGLIYLTAPAEAFDGGDCNSLFGAANVVRATTFSIDTGTVGKVDFGDHLHLGGVPLGTAVVCWARSGAVAVRGRLYADSPEVTWVQAEIRYVLRDGTGGATSRHQVTGNYAASTLVNRLVSDGVYTRVVIRLFRQNTLVHEKTLTR